MGGGEHSIALSGNKVKNRNATHQPRKVVEGQLLANMFGMLNEKIPGFFQEHERNEFSYLCPLKRWNILGHKLEFHGMADTLESAVIS